MSGLRAVGSWAATSSRLVSGKGKGLDDVDGEASADDKGVDPLSSAALALAARVVRGCQVDGRLLGPM